MSTPATISTVATSCAGATRMGRCRRGTERHRGHFLLPECRAAGRRIQPVQGALARARGSCARLCRGDRPARLGVHRARAGRGRSTLPRHPHSPAVLEGRGLAGCRWSRGSRFHPRSARTRPITIRCVRTPLAASRRGERSGFRSTRCARAGERGGHRPGDDSACADRIRRSCGWSPSAGRTLPARR